jgi:hypothetical protein
MQPSNCTQSARGTPITSKASALHVSPIIYVELSTEIFIEPEPGKYYLRVQVSWINPYQLNSAQLVLYSPPDAVTLEKYSGNPKELVRKLLETRLTARETNIIPCPQQRIQVRHTEKMHGDVLGIENTGKTAAIMCVTFKDSKNIKINHERIENNAIEITLDGGK